MSDPQPPRAEPAVGRGMSPAARWGVLALLGVLVFGHLLAGHEDAEWWPLSNYALYARTFTWRERVVPVAEGLTDDGRVVPLDAGALAPLDGGRIVQTLRRTVRGRDTPEKRAAQAAEVGAGLARLYRRNRVAGLHDGPPIAAVRIVRETRRVRPDAANATGPADRREVVAVVPVPPEGATP